MKPRGRKALAWLAIAQGAGLAVVVAADGQWGWRIGRVCAVGLVTTLLVWVALRSGPRALGLSALALGAVGAGIGCAIAPRWLVAAGGTAKVLGAALVLLAGLGLVAGGVIVMVRTAPGRWKVPMALACTVVAALLVWTVLPGVVVTNVPPLPLGSATPGDVELAYEDLSYRSTDGVRLAAWWVPTRTGAAVVLRHGSGSTRADVLAHAAVLARHGYGVLLTDARGHGGSGGRAMDFGWEGDRDITAAIDAVLSQPGVDPAAVAVLGLSMGGEEAIGALAADDRIAAVVAEGVTARRAADKNWYSDAFGVQGWLQEQLEAAQYALADLLTSSSPPTPLEEAIARTDRPVLLIAGGAVADEQAVARRLHDRAPATVRTWTVPDAGHTAGLRVAPDEWERHVVGFLDDALATSQGQGPAPAGTIGTAASGASSPS